MTSRSRAAGEAAAALASVALHVLAADVLHRRFDIPVLGVAWLAYLTLRARADRTQLARWGLTRAGLGPASAASAVVLLAGVAVIAGIGAARGLVAWRWHMALLLVLYPLWGLLQQVLVFGVFLRALETLVPAVASPPRFVPLAALAFGLVHCGDLRLFSATAVLAACNAPIWLRWRNAWPLGVCHGWLGALFYVWVLGRDPWAEAFG